MSSGLLKHVYITKNSCNNSQRIKHSLEFDFLLICYMYTL